MVSHCSQILNLTIYACLKIDLISPFKGWTNFYTSLIEVCQLCPELGLKKTPTVLIDHGFSRRWPETKSGKSGLLGKEPHSPYLFPTNQLEVAEFPGLQFYVSRPAPGRGHAKTPSPPPSAWVRMRPQGALWPWAAAVAQTLVRRRACACSRHGGLPEAKMAPKWSPGRSRCFTTIWAGCFGRGCSIRPLCRHGPASECPRL
jgi:hypothetical protein